MQLLATIAAIFATLLVVDLVWLGVVMKEFYRSQIGHLMSGSIGWVAALVFYAIYAFGIWFFVVSTAPSLGKAFMLGAMLGLIAYATYDLTNQATLKDWPVMVTVIDIVWGSVLTGIAATVGYLVLKALG